jgi:hypothetical protein
MRRSGWTALLVAAWLGPTAVAPALAGTVPVAMDFRHEIFNAERAALASIFVGTVGEADLSDGTVTDNTIGTIGAAVGIPGSTRPGSRCGCSTTRDDRDRDASALPVPVVDGGAIEE